MNNVFELSPFGFEKCHGKSPKVTRTKLKDLGITAYKAVCGCKCGIYHALANSRKEVRRKWNQVVYENAVTD